MRTITRKLKNSLVADGPRLRRLPLGIGRGLMVELDLRHWSALYLGLYEIELNTHLRALCQPGYDAFDVGGQNGYDALVMAKLTGGEVISFECDSDLCERMRRSFAANPALAGRLDVVEGFVAATTSPDRRTVALDDVAFGDDGFVPDVVKVDIEGGELDALRGASRLLNTRRPHFLVETHSAQLERDCADLLSEARYEITHVAPRRWLKDNRPTTEHNGWLVARGSPRATRSASGG
jgi:hypothetical protein